MQLCVEQKSELEDPLSVLVVDEVSVEVDVEQLAETDSATCRNVESSASKSDGAATPRTATPVPQSFRK